MRWTVLLEFRRRRNRPGGEVTILHLPDIGVRSNTHFPFTDLNNEEVADLASQYLHEKRLDER